MFRRSFELILLKMCIKKLVIQLEKHINNKFPEFKAKFYSNRRNFYIHMGLHESLCGFSEYRKLLQEIGNFLSEHLPDKFTSIFPPRLINSTKWKFDYLISSKKMAESNQLTWKVDKNFIPKYMPNNLKWFEKDGLETWYRQNKCNDFLKIKIVNFDIIKNDVKEDTLKQYQTIDHDEIKQYPSLL